MNLRIISGLALAASLLVPGAAGAQTPGKQVPQTLTKLVDRNVSVQ